jgi:hypothetical protein
MRRKAITIGVLALLLALASAWRGPSCCGLIASARGVEHNYRTLNRTRSSFTPVERLVFSLLLPDPQPRRGTT